MRLFIAVNFDQQTKENLLAVQERLRELGRGNFSRPQNLHLTLAFLGEVSPPRVSELRRLMDDVKAPFFRLSFKCAGRFKRDGGDIWWVGIAPDKTLIALQKELSKRLLDAGFLCDEKPFSPHVTLARRFAGKEREIDKAKLLFKPFFTVADTISLMLSERKGKELVYTELHKVRINEG